MTDCKFLVEARAQYVDVIEKTLAWMLERPRLKGAFLNTKQNSVTLRDHAADDVWRGPLTHYGWIQGRGLEALILHARFFETENPALSQELLAAARPLYEALDALHARDGHAYFTYDDDLDPVYADAKAKPEPQARGGDLFTYSDIFVVKGLIAASTFFAPLQTKRHLADLASVVRAVEEGRFIMEERQRLDRAALARQADEYGPRMIMLGAAALLRSLGFSDEAAFGPRFVAHILSHHLETDSASPSVGLLRDAIGEDRLNAGHAIEFVGLSLDGEGPMAEAEIEKMERILTGSFAAGFSAPGLRLSVSFSTGKPLSDFFPWWSLPEATRAAALLHQRTRNAEAFAIWRRTHEAFFANYWRDDARLAYQMRNEQGPVDHAPATSDLDPGYHTGLSYLSTIHAIDALTR